MKTTPQQSWHCARVLHGEKLGRTLGFPTLNLDNPDILQTFHKGVYATHVQINNHIYCGALYYGPRLVLKQTRTVLEIHILNFAGEVYGQTIKFTLLDYIREPQNFSSLEDLKRQLHNDCTRVKSICLSCEKS